MIQVMRWDHAGRRAEVLAADQLPATHAGLGPDNCYWVDLSAPTPDEEERVFGQFLPVHALTREDITRPNSGAGAHLPKVEEFPDYLFVVSNPLPPDDPACPPPEGVPPARDKRFDQDRLPQLSAVLTAQVLVTHHKIELPCVNRAWGYAGRHRDCAARGPDYLFHLVLDAMVDDYAPVVDGIAARLDRLETRLFRRPHPAVLAHLLRLKRKVSFLRKTLLMEREVLARLTRGEFALVDEREVAYYRNVYDHLSRYADQSDTVRDMVSDLMQTHLAASSNRLNEVMKVLTMTSTVILPMTLVAGVYGMNFDAMPELKWRYGYPFAVGLMAAVAVAALALFRWKRWV